MICRWLTSLVIAASLAYSSAEDAPSSCPSWSAEFNPVNNIQVGGSAGSCNSTAIEELLTLTRTILELLQNQEPCCTPSPTPGACASNPCQNGGTCTPTNEGLEYQCTCSAGYTGETCASDIDECVSNPCQNGGTCINQINGYRCECLAGYTGTNCALDACASNPCQNGGTCTPTNEGLEYQCTCSAGYTGATCALDIDECASNPCQNGGTCINQINGYSCECLAGYTGTNCVLDTNKCASNPCQNGGTCSDKIIGYQCDCSPGYTGPNCATDIDECSSNPCHNGGTCTDEVDGYSCECSPGFTGTHCSIDVDECASNPCQNGGTCTDEVNGYSCECLPGFTGTQCSVDIDECASNPCQNGGTCTDEVNGYSCECLSGFIGTHCVAPKDCAEIMAAGTNVSGVYYIDLDGVDGPIDVYCDMETDGGGWTVFQRREDGSVDFYLEWDDYKRGFGEVSFEHWLGNDNIHHLSTQKTYELRVDLEDFDGETRYALYSGFSLADETSRYFLTVGDFSGDAGDGLSYHSRYPFTTKDRDHDNFGGVNCAVRHTGAWWYYICCMSNLNGQYRNRGNAQGGTNGVSWTPWRGERYSLKKTEMKIRPL